MPPSPVESLTAVCEETLPWAVLATGVFITCCATNQFAVIDLLAMPLQVSGQITNSGPQRIGQIAVPKWFPVAESILETAGGEIRTKLKEIPVPANITPSQGDNAMVTIDFSKSPLRAGTGTFTLTYSPWFRFFAEPANFNILSRSAAYVAECVRFLCARNGIAAAVTGQIDGSDVVTPGFRVEVRGMARLEKLRITDGTAESVFDLAQRRILLDERMFPAAVAAGRALLETPDRLLNLNLTLDGQRMQMAYAGAAHV